MIGFLKKKASLRRDRLLDLLHARMGHADTPRLETALHASSIVAHDFCPRRAVLMHRYKVKFKSRYIDPALRYTFDEGNDKQARFNNDWMRPYHVGNWHCMACGAFSHGKDPGAKASDEAAPCVAECDWRYVEIVFKDPVSHVRGSVDSLLDLGDPLLTAVECKIITKDDFKNLAAPLAEHSQRTRLYLYLIEQAGNAMSKVIDTSRATVLYMMRGYGSKQPKHGISPFCDFVVTRDDDLIIESVNRAYAVTVAMQSGKTPLGICSSIGCKIASGCPVSKECFSGGAGNLSWMKVDTPYHQQDVEVLDVRQATAKGLGKFSSVLGASADDVPIVFPPAGGGCGA